MKLISQNNDISIYNSIFEYIDSVLADGDSVGFDGRLVNTDFVRQILNKTGNKRIKIKYTEDIAGLVWKQRPEIEFGEIFLLEEKYSGESTKSKLLKIREKMVENGTAVHVISTLDDISWIYNIRGTDIKYNPVAMAYSVIYMDKAVLFINEEKLSEGSKEYLIKSGVEFEPYNSIYS